MKHKRSKIFLALSEFDAYEMNRLEKFILSPYHNSNETLLKIFSLLRKGVEKGKEPDKEKIWAKLFKGKKYNDQKLRLLYSDLFKLLLDFVGIEYYKENTLQKLNTELKYSIDAKSQILIKTARRNIEKASLSHKYRDSEFFLENFTFESSIFNLTTEFEKKTKVKKTVLNYLDINQNLDYFYLIEKLKWFCNYLSWKPIISNLPPIKYINEIIEIIESLDEIPIELKIYYSIYKTNVDPDNLENYKSLKDLILNNFQIFQKNKAKEMFESLINYTLLKINKGEKDYIKEMLDIYELGIEQGILLTDGKITPTSFRNIVGAALRIKRFDWAEEFIQKKINLIDQKYKKNALYFNLARLYFYKQQFEKVIETVRDVEFNDNLYTHVSKTMILISYYELENDEALFYFAESFKIFLKRRTKTAKSVTLGYLNDIKYIKKLAKSRYNNKILIKLKQEIINVKNLSSRQWFLDKLEKVQH